MLRFEAQVLAHHGGMIFYITHELNYLRALLLVSISGSVTSSITDSTVFLGGMMNSPGCSLSRIAKFRMKTRHCLKRALRDFMATNKAKPKLTIRLINPISASPKAI